MFKLKQVKGLGWLFQEPFVYVWLFLTLLFINLVFSASLSNLYFGMVVTAAAIWLILKSEGRTVIGINTHKKNTLQSLIMASIGWVVFMIIVIVVMGLFQNVFATSPTFSTFLEEHSVSFIGAAKPVLADSKILGTFVFGFLVAVIETYLLIKIIELLLFMMKIPVNNQVIKKKEYWFISVIVSVFITWLHIQAKGIGSDVTLLIVFLFFFVSSLLVGIIPFLLKQQTEKETAIWLHILNNTVAVLKTFRIL